MLEMRSCVMDFREVHVLQTYLSHIQEKTIKQAHTRMAKGATVCLCLQLQDVSRVVKLASSNKEMNTRTELF